MITDDKTGDGNAQNDIDRETLSSGNKLTGK